MPAALDDFMAMLLAKSPWLFVARDFHADIGGETGGQYALVNQRVDCVLQ